MSALGQKQTWQRIFLMSALPPKADIGTQSRDVRFVPKADICRAAKERLFDLLVGARGSVAGRGIEGRRGSFKFRLGGRHL
jgi:hypothetical protein